MEYLIQLDHKLFQILNGQLVHPWLNSFMPLLTDIHRFAWGQALLGFASFAWIFRLRRKALAPSLSLLLCLGASDWSCHHLLKKYFERHRPHVAGLEVQIRGHEYTGFSFPSNHASNVFAGATSLSLFYPGLKVAFFSIAAFVAYSRIYVGAHFPLDIAGGALWGIALGWLISQGTRQLFRSAANSFRARSSNPSS